MKEFGLIGKKLGHSFSKSYFEAKWEREGIQDCSYKLYEIPSIELLPDILKKNKLAGLDVTVPYKEDVIPFVDVLDDSAKKVGAVNVLSFTEDKIVGHNTDYYGFKESLTNWMPVDQMLHAFVLGTGGASKAVQAVLKDLQIPFQLVSRTASDVAIGYESIRLSSGPELVINTTPLGMFPVTDTCPQLPFDQVSSTTYLYDLVYNPAETLFMKRGEEHGAKVINGLEMLRLQAEKSWDIWCAQ